MKKTYVVEMDEALANMLNNSGQLHIQETIDEKEVDECDMTEDAPSHMTGEKIERTYAFAPDECETVEEDGAHMKRYNPARDWIMNFADHDRDGLLDSIKNLFHCDDADVDEDGDVWVSDERRGHWLDDEDLRLIMNTLEPEDVEEDVMPSNMGGGDQERRIQLRKDIHKLNPSIAIGDLRAIQDEQKLCDLRDRLLAGQETSMTESKPSAGLDKKEKSSIVKKAEHGHKFAKKPQNSFKNIEKKAEKEGNSKEASQKIAGAAFWKGRK